VLNKKSPDLYNYVDTKVDMHNLCWRHALNTVNGDVTQDWDDGTRWDNYDSDNNDDKRTAESRETTTNFVKQQQQQRATWTRGWHRRQRQHCLLTHGTRTHLYIR